MYLKKLKTKVVVDEILASKEVFKTNHIFKYGNNILEVIFVDGTKYEKSLVNQEKRSIYLFDEKGFRHLLIIRRKDYETTFKDLYTPDMILSNIKLFDRRRKIQRFGKTSFIISVILLFIVNIIFIAEYGLSKVFYIPIVSVLLGCFVFILDGKIMAKTYENVKTELQNEQVNKNPKITSLLKEEERLAKKNIKG